MKEKGQTKTKEEILEQLYVTAEDLMVLIPGLKKYKAIVYITELIEEMKKQNMFVPTTKQRLVSTKLVKKKFGF